jgi:methylglutamate dehydrogenase subunit A
VGHLPKSSPYVVVGAGIHGLSTAYHLAKELLSRGAGSGADILVLDKAHPGAGASGIACGVVRNNYFQPAMSELMQACVEVWESDPEAYAYNPVGYVALGAAVQEPDLTATYERQERIGYRSELILGETAVSAHMEGLFPDWRARGVTACLHEHQGGFAFNMDSVQGLHGKCAEAGVTVLSGIEVTGLDEAADGSITVVETSAGRIEVGE